MFRIVPVLLLVAAHNGKVYSQDFPAQCDPATTLTPRSLVFLGNAETVQINNLTFSYHSIGPLDPSAANSTSVPTLILIHGLGGTQYDWPAQYLETLAVNRRVIVFDNVGIGSSSTTDEETAFSVEYLANTTVEFISALQLDKPDIAGYSLGGSIALLTAALHPEAIGSVVSVAGSMGGPIAPVPAAGFNSTLQRLAAIFASKYADATSPQTTNTANPITFISSEASSNVTTDDFKLFFPLGFVDLGLCSLINTEVSLRYAAGLLPFEGAGYALPAAGLFPNGIIPDVTAIIPTVKSLVQQVQALLDFFKTPNALPTALAASGKQILLVSGSQDNVIPVTSQLYASSLIPGAWLVQIPDAGHGVVLSDPVEVASVIDSFLNGAQDVTPEARSYYVPASSGGEYTTGTWKLCGVISLATTALFAGFL